MALFINGAWIAARTFGVPGNPAVGVTNAARSLIEANQRATTRHSDKRRRR